MGEYNFLAKKYNNANDGGLKKHQSGFSFTLMKVVEVFSYVFYFGEYIQAGFHQRQTVGIFFFHCITCREKGLF